MGPEDQGLNYLNLDRHTELQTKVMFQAKYFRGIVVLVIYLEIITLEGEEGQKIILNISIYDENCCRTLTCFQGGLSISDLRRKSPKLLK